MAAASSVLISDFDGTMTSTDFYTLVCQQLLTADSPDYWGQYEAGEITHFDALRKIFGEVAAGEERFWELAQATGLDRDIATEIDALRAAGWEVRVVSAGCGWYIEKLLADRGVAIPVYASPGRIENGHLVMELPRDSPCFSPETGIDKSAAVRAALEQADRVAYAGDGPVDLPAALLVPPEFRFARDALARALRDRGERYRPFERWSDISRALRTEPRL